MVVFECMTIRTPTVSLQQILRTLQYDCSNYLSKYELVFGGTE